MVSISRSLSFLKYCYQRRSYSHGDKWGAFKLTCIVLAWAFAKDVQCSCLFFDFELSNFCLYFAVAWISKLFVFSYGFDFWALCISLWLGVQSYLYFTVAWSSELFVFHCGLEFRALCISLWLRLQIYLYFTVAWSSEISFVSGLFIQAILVFAHVLVYRLENEMWSFDYPCWL